MCKKNFRKSNTLLELTKQKAHSIGLIYYGFSNPAKYHPVEIFPLTFSEKIYGGPRGEAPPRKILTFLVDFPSKNATLNNTAKFQ